MPTSQRCEAVGFKRKQENVASTLEPQKNFYCQLFSSALLFLLNKGLIDPHKAWSD